MSTKQEDKALLARAEALKKEGLRRGLISLPPPSLAEFITKTFNQPLHEWQRDYLCPILESLVHEKGKRILIHAAPRSGKSTCVSMRFPAWALGVNPTIPIIISACNVGLATEFTVTNRDLMLKEEYKEFFPADASRIPEIGKPGSREAIFCTKARSELLDGRPSLRALGLQNAFVGKGAEDGILLIDDPYAGWDEAHSEPANNTVWRWWEKNAKFRINDNSNVLVMFHRYHLDDLTARLLAQPGSKWEYYRFPALAESPDAETDAEVGYDPTVYADRTIPGGSIIFPVGAWKRHKDDPLTSTKSREELEDIKKNDSMSWWGLCQGRPRNPQGTHVTRDLLEEIDESQVPQISLWVRFWDLNSMIENRPNDWTAGARVGIGPDGTLYISDIKRIRESWPVTRAIIVETAEKDLEWCKALGHKYSESAKAHVPDPRLEIGVEKVFWQAGMIQDLLTLDIFNQQKGGIGFWPLVPEKKKLARAFGWIGRAKNKQLRLVTGPWTPAFISEALAFDGNDSSGHDDQCDALSGAYQVLRTLNGSLLHEEKQSPPPGSIAYFRERAKQFNRRSEEENY